LKGGTEEFWKEKKKSKWNKLRALRGKGFGGLIFLHNTKRSSFGELKSCIGGGFWGILEGLYELFKFNLYCYNILNIKNI